MTDASKSKILFVDDDVQLLGVVKAHLEKQGHTVGTAKDGITALSLARTLCPDLVVLDVSFPDRKTATKRSMDGIDILRRLREIDNVPIIMLSATNISTVKIITLSLGADDYLAKPFDLHELSARIDAVLRRSRPENSQDRVMTFQRLKLNLGERKAWKDGLPIQLTHIEFDILQTLARRPGHVFTREKLLDLAWKEESYSVVKAVDVHVGHIRKKLEDDPAHPTLIVTVRGTGYAFQDSAVEV